MKTIDLGSNGLRVPVQGFGAMGMSAFYGARNETEAVATLNRAVDLGVTHIDTAEAYGPFENEKLIARALGHRRSEVTIATKFAMDFDAAGTPLDGRAEHVRRAVERSLRHLETDTIDLYYLHRVDPAVPIEETVGAMSELVTAGKVRHLGLSEAAAATIRRAHAVHPITAVQSELSLFSRDLLENGIKTVLDELGIGLVAFSPSAAASCPEPSAASTTSTRTTRAGACPASHPRASPPISHSWTGSVRSPRHGGPLRDRSPWPGLRRTVPSPSPGPSGGPIWRRTSQRPTSP